MTKSLELTGKLDTPASPVVNGPEGDVLDWLSVDWQTVEDDVVRGHEKVPACGQDEVPTRGHVEVPTPH